MKTLIVSTLILAFTQGAVAEKLDLGTHTALIEKLESVMSLETGDAMVSQPSIAHRLADLYAERARLLSLDEEGKGNQIHKAAISSDRKKSLVLLERILPTLDKNEKGSVLMQMAHLNLLQGQETQALKIYQEIERNPSSYDRKTFALAQIQLGDLAYAKSDLNKAQTHFETCLNIKENPRKGYAMYRLAWIHFNLGQTVLAEKELIKILKTPSLMTNSKGEMDKAFQEEASHDLATFMASNDITAVSINTLSAVSPENTRQKNLMYLATELERTAKKKNALIVWGVIGKQDIPFEDRLERQIRVTRIEYDLGNKPQVVKEIENSIAILKSSPCSGNEECVVANQSLRRIITDWGKAEERLPSPELTLAYLKYTQSFEDEDMNFWAAQASLKIKQYKQAFGFYQTSARLLVKHNKTSQKNFEGALLGAIAAAELSQNIELRVQAYKLYLELNSKGPKRDEVKYQIAHTFYEKNDYLNASEEFRKLALDSSMNADLRVKSADLCLDSDVLLKQETRIEAHSLEFSKAIKSKSPEYLNLWRKSVLNQAATVINNQPTVDASETLLRKLNGLTIAQWPADQRKQVIKNKMVLAYRLKDLDMLATASKELLNESKITVEESNNALKNLAWVSEIKMDFAKALTFMKKIKPGSNETQSHLFKIALLKELSGQNPNSEYMTLINISNKASQRQYAAHQIVLNSKKPQSDFRKLEGILAGNNELYKSAGIFVYEKTSDSRLADHLLKKSSVRNSTEGQLLAHVVAFADLAAINKKISKLNVKAGMSDSKLRRTIDQRIQLIKDLEKQANRAIARKDASMQLIILATVARENSNLAIQILSLPAPKGLKPEEKAQYQTQVEALVQPYVQQSKVITAKTTELWNQSIEKNTFEDIFELSEQKTRPGSRLATTEISFLRASAREVNISSDPFREFSSQRRKVAAEALNLIPRIQSNPFNFSYLAKMKSLQSTLGSGPMVAYLDSRLNELKTRGSN
ncbi:MAG: hypothetical protein V4736_06725 [Bdellovibrionota bacterium]